MQPEIEATFINIDKDKLRAKLAALGGKLLQKETLMQRTIFELPGNQFARVRDEGNCITMTYKNVDARSLSGTKEINLKVDNYNAAVDFMVACGIELKSHQETYREEWKLDDVECDIDTWPWLPTFVEIEGPSEESVKAAVSKLGFNMKNTHYSSVDDIYMLYYDITSTDVINRCPEIKFTPVPEWLESRRRPDQPQK